MPKPSKQSIKAFFSDKIEFYGSIEVTNKETTPEEIERRLLRRGLDPHEVELLMLRYVDDLSMGEIVKQQGWVSINSANYFLRKVLKQLREGRFGLK